MAPVQRGKLKWEDEQKIRKNYNDICKNIESQDLTPQLFAQNVINEDDKDVINSKATRRERAEALADRMLNAGKGDNFQIFLNILKEEYTDLVEQIESTEVSDDKKEDLQLPDSVLSLPVTDKHASRVSGYIGKGWRHLMIELGLSPIKIDRESGQHGEGTTTTLTNLIIQWRRQTGKAATWGRIWPVMVTVTDQGHTDIDLPAVRTVALMESAR